MIFRPKRIIILGSTGFIGRYLAQQFIQEKVSEVLGYSSSSCDLLSPENTNKVLSDLTREDAVLMLSTINRLDENSYNSMCKNIEMAENLSKSLIQHPAGHLVFFSTIDVYGACLKEDEVIDERCLPDPGDYYSISKLMSEYVIKKVCAKNDIPLKILRLSGIYGPGDRYRTTVGALVDSARNKRVVHVYGTGNALRDFVYIEDVYRIVKSTIKQKSSGLLNVVTGKSHSILQIVDVLKDLLPVGFDVEFKPEESKDREKRVKNLIFDNSLMKRCFPDLELRDIRKGVSLYLSADGREIMI